MKGEQLLPFPQEAQIHAVSADITKRLMTRLMLESQLGTYSLQEGPGRISRIMLPVGGENGTREISGMIDDARTGFYMHFRQDREGQSADDINSIKLLNATEVLESPTFHQTPDSMRAQKPDGSFSAQPESLVPFRHFLATLIYLRQQGYVSFLELDSKWAVRWPEISRVESKWFHELTPEYVWGSINKLREVVKDSIESVERKPAPEDMLRAAHFFSASEQLALTLNAA